MPPLDVGLVAHNVVRRDGQGRVMLELARALCERGHQVTVYTRALDEELAGRVVFRRMPRAPGPQLVDDVLLFALATVALRRARHDATVVMGPCALPPSPFVYDAQFSHRGWRHTWRTGGAPGAYHRLHTRLSELLERVTVARAERIIASTETVASDVAPNTRAPICVVANGIDATEFPPVGPSERQRAREGLDIPTGAHVVAFLGEYHTTRKGLWPLLQAIALGPPDEVLVVAAHGDRPRLDGRVRQLGLEGRVHVAGFAPARSVLAASDVVAVPSLYEPFSLVALEAAASRVPVVVSRSAGAAGLLAPGVVVVDDASDPVQVRAALDEVRADADATACRVETARRLVGRLTWSALGPAAADVVEAAARSGARR